MASLTAPARTSRPVGKAGIPATPGRSARQKAASSSPERPLPAPKAANAKSPEELGLAGRQLPSLSQQKSFIIDNSAAILNRETKLSILSLVMMEIGPTAHLDGRPDTPEISVVLGSGGQEVNIDLDAVELVNPEIVTHIYNIVHARREALSQPAGAARQAAAT